jgi:hypothetical protein
LLPSPSFTFRTAQVYSKPPLATLTTFVPTSQILFGTDYPAEPTKTTIEPLAQIGPSARDRGDQSGYAERLFPRLRDRISVTDKEERVATGFVFISLMALSLALAGAHGKICRLRLQ